MMHVKTFAGFAPAFSELKPYKQSWTWQELRWGWQYEIVTLSDMLSYAMEAANEDNPLLDLVIDLITEDRYSEKLEEKVEALCRAEDPESDDRMVFVWSYVLLAWIYHTEREEEQLKNKTQHVYCAFGHWDYMSVLIGWMPPIPGEVYSRPWSVRAQLRNYLIKHEPELNQERTNGAVCDIMPPDADPGETEKTDLGDWNMKKGFLAADPVYREQMEHYTLKDMAAALIYYALFMAAYFWMGREQARTGRYLIEAGNLILALIPVLLCVKHLSHVGITLRNLKPSLLMGAAIGLVFLAAWTIIPGIVSGAKLLPAGEILYNVYQYFIIIGLCEEIAFRGFIQPRLFPALKKEWLTILVGGILFVLMHMPFQMARRGMGLAEYWPTFIANAPMQFVWHLVCTWLYRRYGNIFGCAVLHGLVDLSMGIFG